MTHSKQLGSKLLSLLLAFAMILALMPAVSLSAGAAPILPKYSLEKGKPQYEDGWTWDGDTLHLFGSNTYDCSSQGYFKIEAANDETAVVDISGSLTVNLTHSFIMAFRPLEIRGAGKISLTSNSTGGLFDTNRRSLTYAGGAISTDGAINISCSAFTMTQGHIEAPNAFIQANSFDISNSYVSVSDFQDYPYSGLDRIDIAINKSFVDTQSLLAKNGTPLHFTLKNSVMRSAAADAEFSADNAPVFDSVTDSVFYLSNVNDLTWTLTGALADDPDLIHQPADGGGYVFCKRVLTDADLAVNALDGSKLSDSNLSGAFYKDTTGTITHIKNLELTGGIFIVSPFPVLAINTGISANNATIVLLSQAKKASESIGNGSDTIKDCTVVAMNEFDGTNSNPELSFDIMNAIKCNIYSPTSGAVTVPYRENVESMTTPQTSSSFYVPNGLVRIYAIACGDEGYCNITAKNFESILLNKYDLVYHGDICAESFVTKAQIAFDGSDEYSVSFGGVSVTDPGKILLNDTADFACEKPSSGPWSYLSIDSTGYTGLATTQLYIGKPVFNTLAEPDKQYDKVQLYSYEPAVVEVELNLPYDQWVFTNEVTLSDSSGNKKEPSVIGISYDISGEGNTAKITLTTTDNLIEGDYRLYYKMNDQWIGGTKGYVDVTVKRYVDYSMEFGRDMSSSWPYISESGEQKTFTYADNDKIVRAKTWTWYGESTVENGIIYSARTLVLKDGFSFSTTSSNGIAFYDNNLDFHIVFNGECAINADQNSIYAMANLLEVKGSSDSTLTINRGIKATSMPSGAELRIDGGNIRTANVITNSANANNCFLDASTIFLNDCYVYDDNSVWGGGKQSVTCDYLKIARNVTLDLALSTVGVKFGTYIGDLAGVENISNVTVEDSPYRGTITRVYNKADDRMKLVTKPFKLTGDSTIDIADDTVPFSGNWLWGGQTYKIDITDRFSVTSGLTVNSSSPDFECSIEHDDDSGKTYLVINTTNASTVSEQQITIRFADCANRDYCDYDAEGISLSATLGRVVKTSKVGICHTGDYGGSKPEECYTISAEYSDGTKAVARNDGTCDYYLFPSDDTLNLSIIPIANRKIESVTEVEWGESLDAGQTFVPAPSGDYLFGHQDGGEISEQIYLKIAQTDKPQYNTVSVSSDLRTSYENGEVDEITLTYYDISANKTVNDLGSTQYSAYVLDGSEVTVGIKAPDSRLITSINGVLPDYDDNGVYSTKLTVTKDTEITAVLEESSGFGKLTATAPEITDDNLQILTDPVTKQGHYRAGTHCEILVKTTADKFLDSVKFNGTEIKADSTDSDGHHFTVTISAGENKFDVTYTDRAQLTLAKPDHGSVDFAGRLDGGRSSKTAPDGTQDYSIGAGDEVTLTVTPDEGYRVKSATLDGKEVTLTDGKYTFTMTADSVFSVEFEKIPAGNATVTVKCGENGTVSPATADYPIGTEVTLTVTPNEGYEVKSVTLDGKEVTLTDGKYTFTLTANCEFSAEFRKKSTGGNTGGNTSGGHYYGGSSDTGTKKSEPALNGESKGWSKIASDISKMGENSEATINLNGETTLPADVIKAIKDSGVTVSVKVDASKSWTIDGSDIKDGASAADLSLLPGTSAAKGARGSVGFRFTTGGNDLGADLNIDFKPEYAGKFANLYVIKDGKAEFVSTAKIAENGSVTLTGADSKGEYVIMLCDYSDLRGDADNNGKVQINDARVTLYHYVKLGEVSNRVMADFDSNSDISLSDALAILRHSVGLSN